MGKYKLIGFGADFQQRRVWRTDQRLETVLPECKDWPLGKLAGLMSESWKVRGCDWDPPELVVNRRLKKTSRFMWDGRGLHASGKIELAPNMMSSIVLMHELTHAAMLPRLRDPKGLSPHGPVFVMRHPAALGKTLGPRVENIYRENAAIQGVRIARTERGIR